MVHYIDFLSTFRVFQKNDPQKRTFEFEKEIIQGQHEPLRTFKNSLPGVVYARDAIAKCPHSGHEEAIFDQYAVFESSFESTASEGEIWLGHAGIARVYLNGELIYTGENKSPYALKNQPFQWDAEMIKVKYNNGINTVTVALEQTSPYWSFSIRPRDRLGMPLKSNVEPQEDQY